MDLFCCLLFYYTCFVFSPFGMVELLKEYTKGWSYLCSNGGQNVMWSPVSYLLSKLSSMEEEHFLASNLLPLVLISFILLDYTFQKCKNLILIGVLYSLAFLFSFNYLEHNAFCSGFFPSKVKLSQSLDRLVIFLLFGDFFFYQYSFFQRVESSIEDYVKLVV